MKHQITRLLRLAPAPLLTALLVACGAQSAPIAAPARQDAALATSMPAPAEAQAVAAAPVSPPVEQREPIPPAPTPVPQTPVEVNPFTRTADDALSTFALDVDTASYSAARKYLNSGQMPPPDSVRVEEFVNSFDYDYPAPQQGAFAIHIDAAPSPFGAATQIVRVGLQGRRVDDSQRQDAALTFVVDASGSMDRPDRLPLLKESLQLLVEQLRPTDRVGIVVFGSESFVALNPTPVSERAAILRAIDGLAISGATNLEEGMWIGYKLATDNFVREASNRVIMLSDGEANVGATGPDPILERVRDYKAQGVYLSTVGFGMGDYNDAMLERLADAGNGNYSYIDTIDEARKVFVRNLTSTIEVIAKDAKVQVAFNPAVVASYRLLGYENRAVADADFRNDKVDAGEVGAGHSVTALYEVALTGQGSGEALAVQLRYADPQSGEVVELKQPFADSQFGREFETAAPHFRLAVAVAAFAEHLRGSAYAQERPLTTVLTIGRSAAAQLANDLAAQEFVTLVEQAQKLGG